MGPKTNDSIPENDNINDELEDEIEDEGTETEETQNGSESTELTKSVQKRLARARAKAEEDTRAKILRELGAESLDQLKALKEAEEKRLEEQMTELDKAKATQEKIAKERDEALAKLQEVERARLIAKRNEAVTKSVSEQVQHPEDVLNWILANHPDTLNQAMGDDGVVDAKQVKELIAKCSEARPEWFRKAATGTPTIPSNGKKARNTQSTPSQSETELIKKARQGW